MAKRAATTKSSDKSGRLTDPFGNVWTDIAPATADDVKMVALALGVRFPKDLGELLHRYNAGSPSKPYYYDKALGVESHLGALVPLTDLPKRRGLVIQTLVQREVHGMPKEVIPFAWDNGNAGFYCVESTTQRVMYWASEVGDDRLSQVAPSLALLLAGLTEPPY
jgi:hypothetical protein